jgi:3-deoxy-D-manno-octulosonic acid (KDO) 8-phosphate synthase
MKKHQWLIPPHQNPILNKAVKNKKEERVCLERGVAFKIDNENGACFSGIG